MEPFFTKVNKTLGAYKDTPNTYTHRQKKCKMISPSSPAGQGHMTLVRSNMPKMPDQPTMAFPKMYIFPKVL